MRSQHLQHPTTAIAQIHVRDAKLQCPVPHLPFGVLESRPGIHAATCTFATRLSKSTVYLELKQLALIGLLKGRHNKHTVYEWDRAHILANQIAALIEADADASRSVSTTVADQCTGSPPAA